MSVVLKKIGSGLKSFGHFFAALGHAKKQPSPPDPRKAAARKMRVNARKPSRQHCE